MSRDQSFLQLFWELADQDSDLRVGAATNIMSHLVDSCESSGIDPSAVELSHAELGDSLRYTIKRLTRGLMSSNKGARQGFATTLVQLLQTFSAVATSDLLNVVKTEVTSDEFSTKSETRDYNFGRVFVVLVLCRSGRVRDLDDDVVRELITEMFAQCAKKQWFREICWSAVTQIVQTDSFERFALVTWPLISETLSSDLSDWSADHIATALACVDFHKQHSDDQFPHKLARSILKPDNFPLLVDPLRASVSVHPKVHSVWARILAQLLDTVARPDWVSFWQIIVEKGLMSTTHHRKYLGFHLFEKFLRAVPANRLEHIFSQNLMRTLMNNSRGGDNILHGAAQHTLRAIVAVGRDQPEKCLAIVTQLIGDKGHRNFDNTTKSKTIKSLMSNLDDESTQNYVTSLQETFLNPTTVPDKDDSSEDAASAVTSQRIWVVDQLLALAKSKEMARSDETIFSILDFFVVHGQFAPLPANATTTKKSKKSKKNKASASLPFPERPIAATVVSRLQNGLQTIMHGLIHRHNGADKQKLAGTSKDGRFWVCHCNQFVDSILAKKTAVSRCQFDEMTVESRKRAAALLKSLSAGVSGVSPEQALGLELMFEHLRLLQLSEPEEASHLIIQLAAAFQTCFVSSDDKKSADENDSDSDEDSEDPVFVESLVDTILHLLEKESHLLRETAKLSFRSFSSEMTLSALQDIMQIVNPSADDDDEPEESESDDEAELEAFLAEEAQQKKAQGSSSSSDEDMADAADGSGSGSDDQAEDDDIKISFDEAIEQLTDKPTMDIDEMLGHAVKLQIEARQVKKRMMDARKKQNHYRSRVLDLLEIFFKRQAQNPLVLVCVVPLIEAVRATRQLQESGPLQGRLVKIVTKFIKGKEYPSSFEADEIESIRAILEDLIGMSVKASDAEALTLSSLALLFVSKSYLHSFASPLAELQKSNKLDEPRQWLLDVYCEALEHYTSQRRSHLNTKFFCDFVTRHHEFAWHFAPKVLEAEQGACTEYLRFECFAILDVIVKQASHVLSETPALFGSVGKSWLTCAPELIVSESKPKRVRTLVQTTYSAICRYSKAVGASPKQIKAAWPISKKALASLVDSSAKDSSQQNTTLSNIIAVLSTGELPSGSGGNKGKKRKNASEPAPAPKKSKNASESAPAPKKSKKSKKKGSTKKK